MPYPADDPKRGEIYYANLSPVVGAEQSGERPVLIISIDPDIRQLPVVVVVSITKSIPTRPHPRVPVLPAGQPLPLESAVLTFQVRTIDKSRLYNYQGTVSPAQMLSVERGVALSFNLVAHLR